MILIIKNRRTYGTKSKNDYKQGRYKSKINA